MTTTQTETVRRTVAEALIAHSTEAAIRQHERGHHNLLVYPAGEILWMERVSANEWQVLAGTTTQVASLLTLNNDIPCNCDACSSGDDPRDWAGDDAADTLTTLEEALAGIPIGYFADETDTDH